jgi:hypothetical protein
VTISIDGLHSFLCPMPLAQPVRPWRCFGGTAAEVSACAIPEQQGMCTVSLSSQPHLHVRGDCLAIVVFSSHLALRPATRPTFAAHETAGGLSGWRWGGRGRQQVRDAGGAVAHRLERGRDQVLTRVRRTRAQGKWKVAYSPKPVTPCTTARVQYTDQQAGCSDFPTMIHHCWPNEVPYGTDVKQWASTVARSTTDPELGRQQQGALHDSDKGLTS